MATLDDITWYRGDSFPIELTIKDKATGNAVDITGYAFKLTVDELQDPPDTSTKKFSVDGVLDGTPSTGKVAFTPSTTDTAILPADYYYDVQMTDASSNIRTIAKYKFTISQDITK